MIISIKYVIRFAKAEMIYECPIAGERVHLLLLQGGNMAYGSAEKSLKKRHSENLD